MQGPKRNKKIPLRSLLCLEPETPSCCEKTFFCVLLVKALAFPLVEESSE